MRIGFFGDARTSSGYLLPPRMFVKLPTVVKALRNSFGRSQQTVNAQIPPELLPAMQRPSGSLVRLYFLPTSGRISSSRKRAYASLSVSYSKLLFDGGAGRPSGRFAAGSPAGRGFVPG